MAETCGGCAFMGRSFAPTKRPSKDPLNDGLKILKNYRQDKKIRTLESKAETEGLSTREKVDLVATKIDKYLLSGKYATNGVGEHLNCLA